jgi:uncharacterized protein YqgV (UPF0045/DUF77 family)
MDTKIPHLQCSLSILPLGIVDYSPIIHQCLEELSTFPVDISYGSMNTVIAGPQDTVFHAIQHLFQFASEKHPKIVLQVTFSNCCPKK